MAKRVAIMGAGAVGSYLGAFLTREGHDVTLVDGWGEHVNMMKEGGLRVSGTQGEFTAGVNALHLGEIQSVREPFDVTFLSVKSYDTEWASHFIKRFVAPAGVVVGAQNCMNDALIASVVGYQRYVGAIISTIAVALWEPAHVHRGGQTGRSRGHDVFRIGELHGRVTPRVQELAEMLSCIDGAHATSNLWGERWSKLSHNSSTNPVTSMTGLGSQSVAQSPRARMIQVHIVKEAVEVGQAQQYDIEPLFGLPADVWAQADRGDVFEELDAKFQPKPDAADWRSSMAQDVTKGRPTEIEYMNGYIVQQGREIGVPTPINAAIVEVVKEIEAGSAEPDPANVERVLAAAGM